MPEKLPKGWMKTTLGDIVEPSRERASPMEYPDMRYVGLEHIEPHSMRLLEPGYAHEVRSSSVRFSKGDVLYGKMRPYLNKVWVAEFDGLCSAEFLVFQKQVGLNGQFLAVRLNAEDFVTFANGQVSGERPRVDFEKLSRFPILLPPSAEQEKIAAKLNAAFSAVERAEAAARRAQQRLKRYRAAVLAAAATGEITGAWREARRKNKEDETETGEALLQRLLAARRTRWEKSELERLRSIGKKPKDETWKSRYDEPAPPDMTELPQLPPSWVWARLQQLGFVVGGLTKNPRRMGLRLKLPYLRVANVYANELRLDNVASIGVDGGELDRLLLEKGDLLIVEGNGSKDQIGRLAIWDGSIERCVHQNHIIKVRLVEKQMGTWVLSWLLSPPGRGHIEKVASSTTGLYTLSINKVADLPIPFPPETEQTEIVREVERRLTAANRLGNKLDRQFEHARSTRQSLLREAFAGRLVAQEPTDEPASFLLKRIRAAREAETQKPKGKRMPKSESKSKLTHRPLLDILREQKRRMTPEQLFKLSGYQQEFEDNECRQEVVDKFYEELRQLVGPQGPVLEKRPDPNTILLEATS
jgi:type I restriction enzyme S subunit